MQRFGWFDNLEMRFFFKKWIEKSGGHGGGNQSAIWTFEFE